MRAPVSRLVDRGRDSRSANRDVAERPLSLALRGNRPRLTLGCPDTSSRLRLRGVAVLFPSLLRLFLDRNAGSLSPYKWGTGWKALEGKIARPADLRRCGRRSAGQTRA